MAHFRGALIALGRLRFAADRAGIRGIEQLSGPDCVLTPEAARFVEGARVAHLASTSATGQPHVVPVCFVLVKGRIYIGLDAKPKSVDPLRLRRVRNILQNPRVSFLVDRYCEDWTKLGYVMVTGEAELCSCEAERRAAVAALRSRYAQYHEMLHDDAPVLRITPKRASTWGDLSPWTALGAG